MNAACMRKPSSMHVLLITDAYPPEIRSASELMFELANELNLRGHRVTVLTSWPGYNIDPTAVQLLYKFDMTEGNVRVLRIKTLPHHNVNYLLRGVAQLTMPIIFWFIAMIYVRRIDSCIVYSPPLPLGLLGAWLKRRGRTFFLNVQDLFPQNAIDLGILNNRGLIKFFSWMERKVYREADSISVHSEGNKQLVTAGNPEIASKLTVIHNWIDVGSHGKSVSERDTQYFQEKFNLVGKTVAIFAGVIGPSQNMDLLVRLANEMKAFDDLVFLFVGDGAAKEQAVQLNKEIGNSNVIFADFVNREKFPSLLNACDIGLVSLSPSNKTPVVPGKLLGYMAAGLPVAAFLQKSSDAHEIIEQANCGVSADSGNFEACVEAFKTLMLQQKEFNSLGERGQNYALRHFSKTECVNLIEGKLV